MLHLDHIIGAKITIVFNTLAVSSFFLMAVAHLSLIADSVVFLAIPMHIAFHCSASFEIWQVKESMILKLFV